MSHPFPPPPPSLLSGLVELIVLNLGLQAKMLDVEIFTIMVMMALITVALSSLPPSPSFHFLPPFLPSLFPLTVSLLLSSSRFA